MVICTAGHPCYGRKFDPHVRDRARYGTHLPMLTKYLSLVIDRLLWPGGTLVEHGAGGFSSTVMKIYSELMGIPLSTIENDPTYVDGILYANWTLPPYVPLALVDGDAHERQPMIDKLLPVSAYIIVHDVEPENKHYYKWTFGEMLEIDKTVKPWTGVLKGKVL